MRRGLGLLEVLFGFVLLTCLIGSFLELSATTLRAQNEISERRRVRELATEACAHAHNLPLDQLRNLLHGKGTRTEDGYLVRFTVYSAEGRGVAADVRCLAVVVQVSCDGRPLLRSAFFRSPVLE